MGGYGSSVWEWFQYWGGRDSESQIVTENRTFSEPIQNIYQLQTTTEKCRWRQKTTDLSRNFGHSYHDGGFQRRASRKKIRKTVKIPVDQ